MVRRKLYVARTKLLLAWAVPKTNFNPYSAKQISQQTTFTVVYFSLSKTIRLYVSCESSA